MDEEAIEKAKEKVAEIKREALKKIQENKHEADALEAELFSLISKKTEE